MLPEMQSTLGIISTIVCAIVFILIVSSMNPMYTTGTKKTKYTYKRSNLHEDLQKVIFIKETRLSLLNFASLFMIVIVWIITINDFGYDIYTNFINGFYNLPIVLSIVLLVLSSINVVIGFNRGLCIPLVSMINANEQVFDMQQIKSYTYKHDIKCNIVVYGTIRTGLYAGTKVGIKLVNSKITFNYEDTIYIKTDMKYCKLYNKKGQSK